VRAFSPNSNPASGESFPLDIRGFKYIGITDTRTVLREQTGTASGTVYRRKHSYDGKALLEEVDQTGSVLARYTQSKKIDEALAELRSGTASYYEADGLGSSTSLTLGRAGLSFSDDACGAEHGSVLTSQMGT